MNKQEEKAAYFFKPYSMDDKCWGLELRNNWGMIRFAGWQQPENQLFNDLNPKFGGLVSAMISPRLKNGISPYGGFTLKSQGWVAGNPYLYKNFTLI